MKRFLIGAAFAAMASGAVCAQEAQQRYQGALFITATSGGCVNADGTTAAVAGDQFTFVFRSDNTIQAMALFAQRRALTFVPRSPTFGKSGDYVGTYIPSSANPRTAPGRYAGFKIKPAKLGANTSQIFVEGKIFTFEGTAGCDVTFEAGGIRRPGF